MEISLQITSAVYIMLTCVISAVWLDQQDLEMAKSICKLPTDHLSRTFVRIPSYEARPTMFLARRRITHSGDFNPPSVPPHPLL